MTNPAEDVPEVAKVFMTGRSQAVRLPKSCRFEGSEVLVRRVGNSVVLTPMDDGWADAIPAMFAAFGRDAEGDALSRSDEWAQPARDALR